MAIEKPNSNDSNQVVRRESLIASLLEETPLGHANELPASRLPTESALNVLAQMNDPLTPRRRANPSDFSTVSSLVAFAELADSLTSAMGTKSPGTEPAVEATQAGGHAGSIRSVGGFTFKRTTELERHSYEKHGVPLAGAIPRQFHPDALPVDARSSFEQFKAADENTLVLQDLNRPTDRTRLDIKIGHATSSYAELRDHGKSVAAAATKSIKLGLADKIRGTSERGYTLAGGVDHGVQLAPPPHTISTKRNWLGSHTNPLLATQLATCTAQQRLALGQRLLEIREVLSKADVAFVASSIYLTIPTSNDDACTAHLIDLAHPVERASPHFNGAQDNFLRGVDGLIGFIHSVDTNQGADSDAGRTST